MNEHTKTPWAADRWKVIGGDGYPGATCIMQGEEFEGHPFFFMVGIPCEGMKKDEVERCVNNMKLVMNACQMKVENDESVDSQDFVGQELALVVTVEQYEGKDKNVIVLWKLQACPKGVVD